MDAGDRLSLTGMTFMGRHGALPDEQARPQPFEVDVEMRLDLGPASRADDLSRSVDYRDVFDEVRRVVESTSRSLIEAIAESIADTLLERFPLVAELEVRVRKPRAALPGTFERVEVAVRRGRGAA